MGIGNQLIGDLEHLLTAQTVRRQCLFRMGGAASQCWRAEIEIEQMYPGTRCCPRQQLGSRWFLSFLSCSQGKRS
jgi:hypothetical protein